MITYKCIARDGSTNYFSTYTKSDAFQQATTWADKLGGLLSMEPK